MKQQHHKKQSEVGKRFLTDSGVTLVELMIAVVIGMVIIGAIYGSFISQQRSFTAQDQVAEMNSTSKISLDMIVNDIRETGFGVPEAGTYNINGFTNVITATDSTAAPDSITMLGGFRDVATLQNATVVGSNQIRINYLPTTTTRFNLTDKNNISISGITFAVITACTLTADNTCSGAQPITLDRNINMAFPAGIRVYLVEDITYLVVGTQLQRVRSADTDVIAENIEDFQIAYGYDTNDDGVIDLFRDTYPPATATDRLLRIRVNLLATTARDDPNFQGQGKPPDMIENRDHSATPDDSRRRRWWQMEVALRNPI